MNAQRYTANDVHKAIHRLNEEAGRPLQLMNAKPSNRFNVGHFDCDKGGTGAYWKFYEVCNTAGGERAICYAETAQLACAMIDAFRQGVAVGREQVHKGQAQAAERFRSQLEVV